MLKQTLSEALGRLWTSIQGKRCVPACWLEKQTEEVDVLQEWCQLQMTQVAHSRTLWGPEQVACVLGTSAGELVLFKFTLVQAMLM